MWLNVYFILIQFFAALFCYWFCRDLGRTVSASLKIAGETDELASVFSELA